MDTHDDPIRLIARCSAIFGVYCTLGEIQGGQYDPSSLFKCGEIKFGAFVLCPHCNARPSADEELVLSLAMTDHYFDLATMKQMGAIQRVLERWRLGHSDDALHGGHAL